MSRKIASGWGRGSALCVVATIVALIIFPPSDPAHGAPEADARRFATPAEAADALLAAVKAKDLESVVGLVGKAHRDLVISEDEGATEEARLAFLARAEGGVQVQDVDEGMSEILLGKDAWPFPVPLVKTEGRWAFDAPAGRAEVLRRRVGQNELAIIAFCREYGRAQVEYASRDRDGDLVREYATRIRSTSGTRDGLWWPPTDARDVSPLGEFVAAAGDYATGKRPEGTWHGYYVRILTRQGANPPGGAYDYVINGNMIAGFALVAFPAEYRETGVMTFLVSHQGLVLQKDLSSDTEKVAGSFAEYDPDDTWSQATGTED